VSRDHELQRYLTELAIDEQRYKADCWTWLVEQVVTIDEATKSERRWPAHLDYLHDFVDVLSDPDEHYIAVPKSRRMMVSWCLAAWCAHLARYHENVLVLWQSETEAKAAEAVDRRMVFIEDHLIEPVLRRPYKGQRTKDGLIGRLTYLPTGSRVIAVAQGADVFRFYTPSVVVLDEADFQDEGHDALVAAIPFGEKGGKVILVSSSNGPGRPVATICKGVGFVRYRS
jgi:phage FluMu gp28-like protein